MYYTNKFNVFSYDCDLRNRLKVSAAMRYMQQVAGEHLTSFGCSAEVMKEEDMVFLLSKFCLKIHRIPKIHEEIIVGTAPTPTKGVRFVREFIMESQRGERLISAVTYWPLIRVSDRKVLRPSELNHDLPIQPEGVNEYIGDIPFPKVEPDEGESLYEERIKYSHIDVNNHVNNTIYADFVCDALPYSLMSGADLDEVIIGFQHEAVIGDVLKVNRHVISDNKIFITGEHSRAECFKGLVTFK